MTRRSSHAPVSKVPAAYELAVEAEMIAIVMLWISQISEKLTVAAGRSRLRQEFAEQLKSGRTLSVLDVHAAQEAGNLEAHLALREHSIELIEKLDQPAATRAYMQKVFYNMKPGRSDGNGLDNWLRDVGFAALIHNAHMTWPHLDVTRNAATEGPCIVSIVRAALRRHGKRITERQLHRIYTGLPKIEARLQKLIPSHA